MITVMVPLNSNNNLNTSSHNNNNNHGHGQQQQLATQNQLNPIQNSTTQTSSNMVPLINGLHNANSGANNAQQQQQHLSSSENSEQSLENDGGGQGGGGVAGRNSNYKKISNQLKSDTENNKHHKTILLKFPQNLMETDQLIVSC